MHMKHPRRIPVVAAAFLIAATSIAVAEQEASPAQRSNWFWSWLTSTSTPVAKPAKPVAPARVAEPAKPSNNCSSFRCIILVGVGF
jgi:hypothetical protein